jgi:branched-chain amino acid transport system substrate-binding protein
MKRRCLFALLLLLVACSSSNTDSSSTSSPPLPDVPGVTSDEIRFAILATGENNPQGSCVLECHRQGIEAYLAFRNDDGGVHDRKLVVSEVVDDKLTENQAGALRIAADNKVFGVFGASLVPSGWKTLAEASMPTWVWAIHSSEMADRPTIWGNRPVWCTRCTVRTTPYLVQRAEAKRVAIVGYGATQNSKDSVSAQAESIELYSDDIGGAEVVYSNDTLPFGLPNGLGPEVTAIANAGADFVVSVMDINGSLALSKEMLRQEQGDVPILHLSAYNAEVIKANASSLVGDIIQPYLRPTEYRSTDLMENYRTWMKRTGHGLSELAEVGWIDADIAYQGIKKAGPNFDRASVVKATNAIDDYDAGGMVIPFDLGKAHIAPTQENPGGSAYPNECLASLVVQGDGSLEPAPGTDGSFLCWPMNTRAWSQPR